MSSFLNLNKHRLLLGLLRFSHFTFRAKSFLVVAFLLFAFTSLSAQQLETLISQALSNNPEVQAMELRYSVATEKIKEANTLPNTSISAGYFVSEPETRTGAQKIRLSVKQIFPWFGTITARENYAAAMADTEYSNIAIVKRKLVLSVSQSYYLLYAIKEKQNVLERNSQLLKTYEQLALTAVEVGNASAVDVLRLQIRQNELEQQKKVLAYQFLGEQNRLNNLLNRDKDTSVTPVKALQIPTEDNMLADEKLALHPELLKYDKLYASVMQSEILNKTNTRPSIGFGIDYVAVEERPNMSFDENGKDIIMPMLSLSIPIFNNKHKSITAQNKLKQQEINSLKTDKKNKLATFLSLAVNTRNGARVRFTIQTKNLSQAKNAEAILIKNYETGTIDFKEVLDIQELQLKFQINSIEAIKEYYTQTTIIHYLSN
ncbi:MAG: TolC family protein [Cellulophaga sp.]